MIDTIHIIMRRLTQSNESNQQHVINVFKFAADTDCWESILVYSVFLQQC